MATALQDRLDAREAGRSLEVGAGHCGLPRERGHAVLAAPALTSVGAGTDHQDSCTLAVGAVQAKATPSSAAVRRDAAWASNTMTASSSGTQARGRPRSVRVS